MKDQQRFWTIGELVSEFGITARALRFYEDKGLIYPVRSGTARHYYPRDRARLSLLLRGKRIGLSLDEIKELLDLYDIEGGKRFQMEKAVVRFKDQIQVLENQKQDIIDAIAQLNRQITRVEELLNSTEIDEEKYHNF